MKVLALFLTLLLPAVGFAQNSTKPAPSSLTTWKIDPSHTTVAFKVRHLGVAWVRGTFSDVQGEISTDEKDLTKTKVNVEIGTTSISTNNEKRDNHLRSPDFFDSAQFPKMKFVSTKVYKNATGNWLVDGTLTIKDKSKAVTLSLEGPTTPIGAKTGTLRSGLSATTSINRKDFGLTWNNVIEGISVVDDKIEISIDTELIRKLSN